MAAVHLPTRQMNAIVLLEEEEAAVAKSSDNTLSVVEEAGVEVA